MKKFTTGLTLFVMVMVILTITLNTIDFILRSSYMSLGVVLFNIAIWHLIIISKYNVDGFLTWRQLISETENLHITCNTYKDSNEVKQFIYNELGKNYRINERYYYSFYSIINVKLINPDDIMKFKLRFS